jgi:fido (protein-threonine AMPylation protein)
VKLQNTYKKNINYTDIEDIKVRSKDIFQDVISDFSPGMNKSKFCEKGGKLLYDIHFLHPFREGNSRTERTFMYLLGKRCGISLDYSWIDKQTWRMTIAKANQSKSPDSFCGFLKKAYATED